MSYLNWLQSNYKQWRAFKTLPKEIQQLARWPSETYLKYPSASTFDGKRVLNFGCGRSIYKAPNVTNLDCTPGEYIKVLAASEIRIPYSDNTFDLIIANHVMEHLPQWFETMKEFARVLKPGGIIEIWVPPISSDSAFGYRDHINRIGWESFAGCKTLSRSGSNALAAKEFLEVGEFSKLKLIWTGYRTIVKWWIYFVPESLVQWMTRYLRNIVSEIGFKFIKGE
jgi:SAM-dependent methyltransferase